MIKDRIIDFRRVKASEILRNPKNWRTHPESQRDAMKGVLAEIGIADALIARETEDGLMLIDGHLRTDLDDDTEWPVLILDVNEQEADTILATLDPLAAMAGVSKKFLAELITDLEVSDNNLQTMLNNLGKDLDLFPPPEIVEDDVPEPPKNPITKPGDLWILGNHRLLCGDSTNLSEVERSICGKKADLLFTDPPYGVSYADKNKYLNSIGKPNSVSDRIENDHRSVPEMFDLWVSVFNHTSKICTDQASYYICSPQGGELMMMMKAISESPWSLKHTLIWVKNNHVLGRCDYHYQHEPILYGWKKKGTHRFFKKGNHTKSIWNIPKPHNSDLHPTTKPVALVTNAILNSTTRGQLVSDIFMGSGTTLIAAEQLNRQCCGIEISPQYCDVIIERWEKFSGGKAIRQGSNGAPRKRKVRKKTKKKTAKAKS